MGEVRPFVPPGQPLIAVPDQSQVGHIVNQSDCMDRVFAKISEREARAMVESSDELRRILEAEPDKFEFSDAFDRGPDGRRGNYIVDERGDWIIRITDPSWPDEYNKKRAALYIEMTDPKRRMEVRRAAERQAKEARENVRDVRSGIVLNLPHAAVEALIRKNFARSPGVTGRRRRVQ